MEKLAELRRKLGVLQKENHTLCEDAGNFVDDAAAFSAHERKIADSDAAIKRVEAAIAVAEASYQRSAALAQPVTGEGGATREAGEAWTPPAQFLGASGLIRSGGWQERLSSANRQFDGYLQRARSELRNSEQGFAPKNETHFRSFGEQLLAVYREKVDGRQDPRLKRAFGAADRFNRVGPSGASEVDPTSGGFFVQVDFSLAIWMLAHDMGEILGRVNKIPISANANGIKIPGVDETSRATGSRWGGVQSYWIAEGLTVAPSKPLFRLIEFDLHKLMSLMYTTDELLQDSTALSSIAGQAFAEEIMFMTEDAIVEGSGAGLPLGVLNSAAIVSVAKEAGQANGTIVKANIDNMFSRCWARSRLNATWFINQDAEPQLYQLNQNVGTGGQLVYMPPGGMSGAPYATLFGRPIVVTEYNPALGTPGDLMLADLSQYTLVDKGGVQTASSMHVAFNTDEMVFRITYRVDGRPMWTKPLTPFKGSLTKSPFVVLAQR